MNNEIRFLIKEIFGNKIPDNIEEIEDDYIKCADCNNCKAEIICETASQILKRSAE